MIRSLTLIVVLALGSAGCAKTVIRNSLTFQAETMSALKRQEEAAVALRAAAEAAKERGDQEACEKYAGPALLIEASAQAQAYRALWLAGLPYPTDATPVDGELPDPGPSAEIAPVSSICE